MEFKGDGQWIRDSTLDHRFWHNVKYYTSGRGEDPPFRRIKGVRFSLRSALSVQRMSVAQVNTTSLYERNLPRPHGLHDPRAGTFSRSTRCGTCCNDSRACTGHEMFIQLPLPVIHTAFRDALIKILRCICFGCKRLRVKDKQLEPHLRAMASHFWDPITHLRNLSDYLKNKSQCAHCQSVCTDIGKAQTALTWSWTPKNLKQLAAQINQGREDVFIPEGVDINGLMDTYNQQVEEAARAATAGGKPKRGRKRKRRDLPKIKRQPISNEFIRRTLLAVDAEVYRKLGIDISVSHPADAILTVLSVPPPATRPPTRYSENIKHRSEHDFTLRLKEVIKCCDSLRNLLQKYKSKEQARREEADLRVARERLGLEESDEEDEDEREAKPAKRRKVTNKKKKKTNRTKKPAAKRRKKNDGSSARGGGLSKKPIGIRQATQNARAKRANKSPQQLIQDAHNALSVAVFSFHDCDSMASKKPGGSGGRRPSNSTANQSSIMSSWNKKTGTFRDNCLGKRLNFSARTVIATMCTGRVTQLALPTSFSQTLTIRSWVQEHSIEELRKRVLKGVDVVDGAKAVIATDGTIHDLRLLDPVQRAALACRLEYNMRVEHPLPDSYEVLANRQPTLGEGSLMAHEAKHFNAPTSHSTPPTSRVLRFDNSALNNYRGDCDGDAMHVIVGQGPRTRAEFREIVHMRHRLISANHRPQIFPIQDTLAAAYMCTQADVRVPSQVYWQCLAQAVHLKQGDIDYALDNFVPKGNPKGRAFRQQVKWYHGRDLVSALLPRNFTFEQQVTRMAATQEDTHIVIRRGRLESGVLCKKSLGGSTNGIINALTHLYGGERTLQFVGDIQLVLGCWLAVNPFSMSFEDLLITPEAQCKTDALVKEYLERADELAKEAPEKNEHRIQCIMQDVVNQAGVVALDDMSKQSGQAIVVASGATGSLINIVQTKLAVGQQTAGGHRIGAADQQRTLPCYPTNRGWQSAVSRGFVSSSLLKGMGPSSTFMHLIAAWDALIKTSVNTKDTGYIQRKLSKEMEDLVSRYDGTVRNPEGVVYSFNYGGDGFDASRVFSVSIEALRNPERWSGDPVVTELIERCRDDARCVVNRATKYARYLPFNVLHRLCQYSDVAPKRLERKRRKLREFVLECRAALLETIERYSKRHFDLSTVALRLHILTAAPMDLYLSKFNSKGAIRRFFESLDFLFHKALLEAGSGVGELSAESIGAVLTQNSLSSFHYTGMSNEIATRGVPRLKELVNVSPSISTPQMQLWVEPGEDIHRVARLLVFRTLDHLVTKACVCYQPDLYSTKGLRHENSGQTMEPGFLRDQKAVVGCTAFFRNVYSQTYVSRRSSPFVLVLRLNRRMLADIELTTQGLAEKVRAFLGDETRYFLETSSPALEHAMLRIRITNVTHIADRCAEDLRTLHPEWSHKRVRHAAYLDLYQYMTHALLERLTQDLKLGGIEGITGAEVISPNDELSLYPEEQRIVTSGSCIQQVWRVPGIDWKCIVSNDVSEVISVFGIEAGTLALFHEFRTVLSADGPVVSDRHVMLLASSLTITGVLLSLTRHTQDKKRRTTFVKVSFEKQRDVIASAALFGANDAVHSMADSIMVGVPPRIGTGIVALRAPDWYKKHCGAVVKHREGLKERTKRKGGGRMPLRSWLCTDADDDKLWGEHMHAALLMPRPPRDQEEKEGKVPPGGSRGVWKWRARRRKHRQPRLYVSSSSSSSSSSKHQVVESLTQHEARAFTLFPDQIDDSGLVLRDGSVPMETLNPQQMQRLAKWEFPSPVISGVSGEPPPAFDLGSTLESIGKSLRKQQYEESKYLYSPEGKLRVEQFKRVLEQIFM